MPNFRLQGLPRIVGAVSAVLVAALLVAGCTPSSATGPRSGDQSKPLVLTTFTVLADMARNVAGDALRVESITKVGAEIHEYEPTPEDLRRTAGADLVLENGLGLELWFARFIGQADVPHVVASEGIETIPVAIGAYEGKPNPHAWMSPAAAQIYLANIADAFADLMPEQADTFRANAKAYGAEIAKVGESLSADLETLPPSQRALVTCEGAFPYLTRDYGLAEKYLWPMNSDAEGSPQQIASAIGFVRDQGVAAVFCESTVSDKAQQQVARESGARFGGVLYVDSLSQADGPVPTYLDLLRHDVEVIVTGLKGTS